MDTTWKAGLLIGVSFENNWGFELDHFPNLLHECFC